MATIDTNLSLYKKENLPDASSFKIGIVVSEWNDDITSNLLQGAFQTLVDNKVDPSNIFVRNVPGAFELPLGCQLLLEANEKIDGVIAIGCVIQGESKHFDFVCQGASSGIMKVQLEYNTPISFCVLTDNNKQQSIERSGGKLGNKGIESAVSVLKMIGLQEDLG
jgi:6,7-dimethyl-8-ribityllumazine synthase